MSTWFPEETRPPVGLTEHTKRLALSKAALRKKALGPNLNLRRKGPVTEPVFPNGEAGSAGLFVMLVLTAAPGVLV